MGLIEDKRFVLFQRQPICLHWIGRQTLFAIFEEWDQGVM